MLKCFGTCGSHGVSLTLPAVPKALMVLCGVGDVKVRNKCDRYKFAELKDLGLPEGRLFDGEMRPIKIRVRNTY